MNTFAKETREKSFSHAPPWLIFTREVTSLLLQRLSEKLAGKRNFRDQIMYSYPVPQGCKHCLPPGHPGMPCPKTVTAQHSDLTLEDEKTDGYLSCGMFFPCR